AHTEDGPPELDRLVHVDGLDHLGVERPRDAARAGRLPQAGDRRDLGVDLRLLPHLARLLAVQAPHDRLHAGDLPHVVERDRVVPLAVPAEPHLHRVTSSVVVPVVTGVRAPATASASPGRRSCATPGSSPGRATSARTAASSSGASATAASSSSARGSSGARPARASRATYRAHAASAPTTPGGSGSSGRAARRSASVAPHRTGIFCVPSAAT